VYTVNLLFFTLSSSVLITIQTSTSHILFICRSVDSINCSAILHIIYIRPYRTTGVKKKSFIFFDHINKVSFSQDERNFIGRTVLFTRERITAWLWGEKRTNRPIQICALFIIIFFVSHTPVCIHRLV